MIVINLLLILVVSSLSSKSEVPVSLLPMSGQSVTMATRIIRQLEIVTPAADSRQWFERFDLFAQANQLFTVVPVIPELAECSKRYKSKHFDN